ncbi:MAG: hypothetical protein CVU41_09980 [Chloroflexi bacterium HGW-Chloroflexi-3]|nr:MAG: hypothetical protein CVU41_09980 [Chloroflexi bacterium HGW-Chloroflexi-3]
MAQKITLKIEGMECPNCSMILESMEDKLDGLLQVEASYHKEQVKVEFDENKVTISRIKAEVQRLGYRVVDEG